MHMHTIHSRTAVLHHNSEPMRIKNRYIIAQALPAGGSMSTGFAELRKLVARDFHQAVREKIQELFGDVGSGEIASNTMVKYYECGYSCILVARCPREHEVNVRLVLSCLTKVRGIDLIIRTLRIKGSARTCADALQELQAQYLEDTIVDETERRTALDTSLQTISSLDM